MRGSNKYPEAGEDKHYYLRYFAYNVIDKTLKYQVYQNGILIDQGE